MLLKKVKLNGLFSTFNHEIVLNNGGISIIIGENGVGKTYLLEAINSLFTFKLGFFRNLEFKNMILEFDDNIKWVVETFEKEEQKLFFSISEISNNNILNQTQIALESYPLANGSGIEIRRLASQIYRNIPSVERINPIKYFDHSSKTLLNANELISEYSDALFIDLFEEYSDFNNAESWIMQRVDQNRTQLIETQRIYTFFNDEESGYSETIMRYASELSDSISSIENKYSQESSKLDESFPYRLISKIREDNEVIEESAKKIEELSDSLVELDRRRGQLKNIGLLTNEDSKKINKSDIKLAQEAIELYIEDSNKKFDVYRELQTKISLFLNIINKRFSHKKIQISKEKGFIFKQLSNNDDEGKEIPIRRLSSGEKNELILFYDLLFKSDDTKLVLIDEPEISLHISWQSLFIEDIKSIHELNGINVLIATHSPDIIGANWDITNKLGKCDEDEK